MPPKAPRAPLSHARSSPRGTGANSVRRARHSALDEEERRRSAAPLPGLSGTTWSRASCDVVPSSTDRRSAGKRQLAIADPLRPKRQRALAGAEQAPNEPGCPSPEKAGGRVLAALRPC